jgi:Zn-dependent protease
MKIFGMPVKVEASFLLVLFMAMARSSDLSLIAEWGLVVFFSVLVHEMGHGFAGRAFGLEPQITLYAMGGLTSWTDDRKAISPVQSICISLAGPLSGLLLGGLVFLLKPFYAGDSFLIRVAIADLLWANIAWSLFNLLPIIPLDGGHIVESLEEWWRGKSENLASTILSIAVAAAVCLWAFTTQSSWVAFLTAWFLWSNATTIIRRIQLRFDQPLEEKLKTAGQELQNGNGKALIKLSEEVFTKARSEPLKRKALELLIYGYTLEQDFGEAQKRLYHYKALFGANLYIEGYILYCKGEYEQAIKLFEEVFDKEQSLHTGRMLFQALLEAKRPQQALQLFSHAVFDGRSASFYLHLQSQAFEQREMDLAAQLGLQAFEKTKDPAIAYNIACAFAMQGNLPEALQWLRRAVESGFSDKTLMESDADIAEVRKLPEFEPIYRLLAEKAEACV